MAYGSLQKRRLEGLAAVQAAPAEAAQLAAYKAQLLQEASDALLDAGEMPALHLRCQTLSQGSLRRVDWLQLRLECSKSPPSNAFSNANKQASAALHRPVVNICIVMGTTCQGLLRLSGHLHPAHLHPAHLQPEFRPASCQCLLCFVRKIHPLLQIPGLLCIRLLLTLCD